MLVTKTFHHQFFLNVCASQLKNYSCLQGEGMLSPINFHWMKRFFFFLQAKGLTFMSFMSNKGHLDFYYMVQSCAFAQNNQHWAICGVSIQNKHHYSCKLCPSQVCIWRRKTNLFNYRFSNAYHICQYSLLQWLGFMMMILLGEIYQHSARFFSPQKYHMFQKLPR